MPYTAELALYDTRRLAVATRRQRVLYRVTLEAFLEVPFKLRTAIRMNTSRRTTHTYVMILKYTP
jgi:hypothetical protein